MTTNVHQLPLNTDLLNLGATGEAVRQLQLNLNTLRVTFIPVPVTGTFDLDTSNAVKAFQMKNNLPVTGAVDSETRIKLDAAVGQYAPATALAAPASMNGRAAAAPPAKLPLWQVGLMALGGLSLIGGAFWLVTREDKDDAPSATDDSGDLGKHKHHKELKKPTKTQKCSRTPDAEKGDLIVA